MPCAPLYLEMDMDSGGFYRRALTVPAPSELPRRTQQDVSSGRKLWNTLSNIANNGQFRGYTALPADGRSGI